MNKIEDPVFVYLDNSNIFLSTQYHSSKVNNYKDGILDVQCRINTKNLLEIVLGGRNPTLKKAYGHMTKEVKHELGKAGFTVFLSDSVHGEKEVDTQLTADAVEDVVRHHFLSKIDQTPKGTLILLSGDKDICPVVKLVRRYGWNVEVWAYSGSLSGALQIEMERKEYGSRMEVKQLESHFESFAFYEDKNPEIQLERTLIVKFNDGGAIINNLDESTKEMILKGIKEKAKSTFQLPIATKFTQNLGKSNEVVLAVVLVLEEKKGKKSLYNFQNDVMDKVPVFERDVNTYMSDKFGFSKLKVRKLGTDPAPRDRDHHPHTPARPLQLMSLTNKSEAHDQGKTGLRCPIDQHPAYRTKFCTRQGCNRGKCTRAHSTWEIRCYTCSGNHETGDCR